MSNSSRIASLEAALHNEKREMEFFTEHAERIKNPLGKEIFQEFADRGRENYNLLEKLRQKWISPDPKRDSRGTLKKPSVADYDYIDYEDKISSDIDTALADYDDFKILEMATKIVDKAVSIFSKFSDMVTDPKEKELFRNLAWVERESFMNLKDVEEYLKDPQSWFTEMEHHGLDGG